MKTKTLNEIAKKYIISLKIQKEDYDIIIEYLNQFRNNYVNDIIDELKRESFNV